MKNNEVKPFGLLSKETITDLFITALEGGSNYWYYLPQLSEVYTKVKEDECLSEAIPRLLLADKALSIPVFDAEDRNTLIGAITQEGMKKAEKLLIDKSSMHLGDILAGQWDAISADVYFQYVVLGEIIYG